MLFVFTAPPFAFCALPLSAPDARDGVGINGFLLILPGQGGRHNRRVVLVRFIPVSIEQHFWATSLFFFIFESFQPIFVIRSLFLRWWEEHEIFILDFMLFLRKNA